MKTIPKVTTKFTASNFIQGSFGLFIFVGMKLWRKLLWPFVPFYYVGSLFIKKMYDWGIFKSTTYNFPIITVGNISAGGTGKSPFVIYLVGLFFKQKKIAVLSRGYKRKTTGFHFTDVTSNATDVGDEPLQLKKKFPEITVAVDADRKNGISKLQTNIQPNLIILDDAFQHRKVKAGFQIILTTYYNLYVNDYPLPAGDLREPKSAAKRANCVVVTKCPLNIASQEKQQILQKLKPQNFQKVYFTGIHYGDNVIGKTTELNLQEFLQKEFCLVTGIATPKPMLDYLKSKGARFTHKDFPDHHNFSFKEIDELADESLILTTEKDYMRLFSYKKLETKLFYLPIEIKFLGKEQEFKDTVLQYIN